MAGTSRWLVGQGHAALVRAVLHALVVLGANALALFLGLREPHAFAVRVAFLDGHELRAVDLVLREHRLRRRQCGEYGDRNQPCLHSAPRGLVLRER
jgi:hypothetical protein